MSYKKQLSTDKKLLPLLVQNEFFLEKKSPVFIHLIRSIIGQQLSTKVATVIYERFLNLFSPKFPKLSDILDTPLLELKRIGLSKNKSQYVHNVAQFFIDNELTDKKLHKMTNDKLMQLFTQIKGIGQWSVQMMLMFVFAREDVFSVDDLGIQKAMIDIYKIKYNTKKELTQKMEKIANQWQPFKTYACLHLWHYKDTKS